MAEVSAFTLLGVCPQPRAPSRSPTPPHPAAHLPFIPALSDFQANLESPSRLSQTSSLLESLPASPENETQKDATADVHGHPEGLVTQPLSLLGG